jgi:hypothetical protein
LRKKRKKDLSSLLPSPPLPLPSPFSPASKNAPLHEDIISDSDSDAEEHQVDEDGAPLDSTITTNGAAPANKYGYAKDNDAESDDEPDTDPEDDLGDTTQPVEYWICESCSYSGNTEDMKDCFQCHTPKPLTPEEKAHNHAKQVAEAKAREKLQVKKVLRIKLLKGDYLFEDHMNGRVYSVVYVDPANKQISNLSEITPQLRSAYWAQLMSSITIADLADKRLYVAVYERNLKEKSSSLIGYGDVRLDHEALDLAGGEAKSVTIPLKFKKDGVTHRLWRGDPDSRHQATVTLIVSYKERRRSLSQRSSLALPGMGNADHAQTDSEWAVPRGRARAQTTGNLFTVPDTARGEHTDPRDFIRDVAGNALEDEAAGRGRRNSMDSFGSKTPRGQGNGGNTLPTSGSMTSRTNASIHNAARMTMGARKLNNEYQLIVKNLKFDNVMEVDDGEVFADLSVLGITEHKESTGMTSASLSPKESAESITWKGKFGPFSISDFATEKLSIVLKEKTDSGSRPMGYAEIRLASKKIALSTHPKTVSLRLKDSPTENATVTATLVLQSTARQHSGVLSGL